MIFLKYCWIIPIACYILLFCCVPPSQVVYKKGHDERKRKYTSLADPPELELAKKNFANLSNVRP